MFTNVSTNVRNWMFVLRQYSLGCLVSTIGYFNADFTTIHVAPSTCNIRGPRFQDFKIYDK
jgi:hypothetical protein